MRNSLCPSLFGLLHTVNVANANLSAPVCFFLFQCLSLLNPSKMYFKIERVSDLISFSLFPEPASTELTGLFVEKPPASVVAVAGLKHTWMNYC